MSPKTWLAVVAAVASLLIAFLNDNSISTGEWVLLGTAFITALNMYVVPNLTDGIAKYAKGIVTFLLAAFGVLYTVLQGGVTTAEWLMVAVAGLTAIGVPLLPAPQFPASPAVDPRGSRV